MKSPEFKEHFDSFFYYLDNYKDNFDDVLTDIDEDTLMKALNDDMTDADYANTTYDTKVLITLRYVLLNWFEEVFSNEEKPDKPATSDTTDVSFF